MRFLSNLLLVFNSANFNVLNSNPTSLSVKLQRNDKAQELLRAAKEIGQVGSLASEEDQKRMEELAADLVPLSESDKPARFPLEGEHDLVYSAAPGPSSGRFFGNIVGKVTQIFENEEVFYNRVAFGPLQITLRAKREVKSDSVLKISFLETKFSLFGKTFKEGEVGGGGAWKAKFVGTIEDDDGKKKLVRVMETPSLFVLEQDLEKEH